MRDLLKVFVISQNYISIKFPKSDFMINLITPMSDQKRISSYNINTISSSRVMRTKKNIS